MKTYSVAALRTRLREALNAVEAGEMVVINRHGVDFVLTTASHWNDKQVQAQKGFATLVTDEVSSNIRPEIVTHKSKNGFHTLGSDPTKVNKLEKKSELATPTPDIESKVQEFAKDKGMKFCANGHAIPAGRTKCMGKGCKYA